ncbi:MAG TPA: lysophospholipid acyltransferase family protein [Bacteroidales bacterium]|nr:lysophospholipid acyltransferase family protein [Bacteroidales bacterium]
MYLYTALGVLITLIFAFLHLRRPIDIISQIWAKSVLSIIGKKFSLTGLDNIEKGSKYILLANHSSLFDIVAIMSICPGITWFGHERLLKVPLFGNLLKLKGYVAFKEPNYRNTKNMIEQLVLRARDRTVAIFPEGTRTLDGKINEFYRGFIYLLRNTDINILPVTLNGFYDLKPKNRSYINFDASLEIIIHKPIKRDDLIDKTDIGIIETVKAVIESAYTGNNSDYSRQTKKASIIL